MSGSVTSYDRGCHLPLLLHRRQTYSPGKRSAKDLIKNSLAPKCTVASGQASPIAWSDPCTVPEANIALMALKMPYLPPNIDLMMMMMTGLVNVSLASYLYLIREVDSLALVPAFCPSLFPSLPSCRFSTVKVLAKASHERAVPVHKRSSASSAPASCYDGAMKLHVPCCGSEPFSQVIHSSRLNRSSGRINADPHLH